MRSSKLVSNATLEHITLSANDSMSGLKHPFLSKKVSWFVFFVAVVVVSSILAFTANRPIGPGTVVRGTLSQPCVADGRYKGSFRCVAKLQDGSIQTYRVGRPLNDRAEVTFLRRNRRYVGFDYEPQNY